MLDDDKPDYFLSDDDAESPKAETPGSGNVIDFGTPDTGSGIDNMTGRDIKPAPRRRRSLSKALTMLIIAAVGLICIAFYIRYCTPYAQDAAMRAYVVNVEKRGLVFKTYEAQILSADELLDTSHVYSHPLEFTVADEAMAHALQNLQGRKQPVTIRYEKYYATLPWRGASKFIITSVE